MCYITLYTPHALRPRTCIALLVLARQRGLSPQRSAIVNWQRLPANIAIYTYSTINYTLAVPSSFVSRVIMETVLKTFRKSCSQHALYPLYELDVSRYGRHYLKRYQERWHNIQKRLPFLIDATALNEDGTTKYLVACRDVSNDGKVDTRNLCSDAELSDWLGDGFNSSPNDPQRIMYRPDPRCRLLYVRSRKPAFNEGMTKH